LEPVGFANSISLQIPRSPAADRVYAPYALLMILALDGIYAAILERVTAYPNNHGAPPYPDNQGAPLIASQPQRVRQLTVTTESG
jgi:hypothetical protein